MWDLVPMIISFVSQGLVDSVEVETEMEIEREAMRDRIASHQELKIW